MEKTGRKYVIVVSQCDYDCSAPNSYILNETSYSSWYDAYDAIVADMLEEYGAESIEQLENLDCVEIGLPERKQNMHAHKCATAYAFDEEYNEEKFWDIQTIN